MAFDWHTDDQGSESQEHRAQVERDWIHVTTMEKQVAEMPPQIAQLAGHVQRLSMENEHLQAAAAAATLDTPLHAGTQRRMVDTVTALTWKLDGMNMSRSLFDGREGTREAGVVRQPSSNLAEYRWQTSSLASSMTSSAWWLRSHQNARF